MGQSLKHERALISGLIKDRISRGAMFFQNNRQRGEPHCLLFAHVRTILQRGYTAQKVGGEGGIRTLEGIAPLAV